MESLITPALIRPIRSSDNTAMAKIIRQVMTEYGAVGEGYSINDPEVDSIFENYQGPSHAFYVIELEKEVVGGAGIAPLLNGESDVCELRKMYLLPEARGKGLGKKLLHKCLETAREKGFRLCYLETLHRMESARLLYVKAGFELLSGPMGQTGHNSCDAWYCRLL